MSNISTISRSTATPQLINHADFSPKELQLIGKTVAKDCDDTEFDLFISYCHALKLDPRRRQIYCFIYSKRDPEKRKMSIIVGMDGFRSIADRTGCYRPDEDEPTLEFDDAAKDPNLNPTGLVKAIVRVHKFSHGAWHKVTASAHWVEFAPIKDEWIDRQKTGKQTLDTSGQWGKMPRLMLAKVAEALALRKAWPDEFSGVYAPEEMDRTSVIDLTASEMAEQGATEERLAKLSLGNGILIQWQDNSPLESVPLGQMADRCFAFIRDNLEEPSAIAVWRDRNRAGLQEFWARAKADALAVREKINDALKGLAP